ncbi:MAG: archaeosortase/exosortase family protein [Verrucomicrobiae bacterium]|nr:archaeosortase/exosortase family protein [Verrucomicrobiae bacterium]
MSAGALVAPFGWGPIRSIAASVAWRWSLLVAAFWPVWAWYVTRLCDGSDEPLGIVALAVAAAVVVRRRPAWRDPLCSVPVAVLLAAYALTWPWVPPLVRSVLAVMTLCAGLGRFPGGPGTWGLALLSLPIESTVQFFLGYPLRLLAGAMTTRLLGIGGLSLEQQGVALLWRGETVLIDAPCSGVKMLWLGGVLLAGIAAWRGIGLGRTFLLGGASLVLLLAGNALRNAALFLTETRLVPAPEWSHGPIGLAILGCCVLLMLQIDRRCTADHRIVTTPRPRTHVDVGVRTGFAAALCLIAALMPALAKEGPAEPSADGACVWPLALEGRRLQYRPLTAEEQRFARGFPGQIAVASMGARRIVLRFVARPTRRLHPAADCLRGIGYTVRPLPAWRDADGHVWSRFQATKPSEACVVREQITDVSGRAWSDVSAWYWAAVLGQTEGPWLAVTAIESAAGAAGMR